MINYLIQDFKKSFSTIESTIKASILIESLLKIGVVHMAFMNRCDMKSINNKKTPRFIFVYL